MTQEALLTKITELLATRNSNDMLIRGFLLNDVMPLIAYRPKAEQEEALKLVFESIKGEESMDTLWELLRHASGNSLGTSAVFGDAVRALENIPFTDTSVSQTIEQNLFPLLTECSDTELIDFFRLVEKRFRLSRREKTKLEQSFQQYREKRKIEELARTPNEEYDTATLEEALQYLSRPDFFERLERDVEEIGLVGEKENAKIIYLIALSARMHRPLHAAVFGVSSGGKTSLVKTVLSLFPKSSKLIISSASARAFEYLDPALTENRIVFVEEFEGMQHSLDTLRLIMSESNATRLVAMQDPRTGTWTAQLSRAGHKFALVTSTTRPFIPSETSNRMFCLYIDQEKIHLQHVGDAIRMLHTLDFKQRASAIKRMRTIHHAMHKLLKKVEVGIPYVQHIKFPSTKARHNRDLEKFLSLIEVIAFVRQFQKKQVVTEHGTYVEADIEDYRVAYDLLPYALSEGFEELSKPEENLLKVAVLFAKSAAGEKRITIDNVEITTRDILIYAKFHSFDVGDQTRVGQILNSLEFKGFVEARNIRKQGSRRKYVLAFQMDIDRNGNLSGIENSLRSMVSTPEELAAAISESTLQKLSPQSLI